jgi:Cft2 family RNA processing exonuclease
LNEFSAHADQKGLLSYIKNIKALKKMFLVHGEPLQAKAFKAILEKSLPAISIEIPSFGQSIEM